MVTKSKFTLNDLWRIIIAVGAFLTVALAGEGQLAMLGAAAILIVWVLNFLFERWKVQLHKDWLTGILAVLSLGMVFIYQPELFPVWPILTPELWFKEIVAYIGELITSSSPIVAAATLAYNILLEGVLSKLKYILTNKFF